MPRWPTFQGFSPMSVLTGSEPYMPLRVECRDPCDME